MKKESFPVLLLNKTELFVIEKLSQPTTATATDLCIWYQNQYPTSPKQSIYKALASLRAKEIVTGNKQGYSLSLPWLDQVARFVERAKNTPDEITILEERSSLLYTFADFEACDLFLSHVHRVLEPLLDRRVPAVFHNPHQWFFVTRTEQERATWQHMTTSNILSLMTTSAKTDLDGHIGRNIFATHALLKFSFAEPLVKNTNYLAVLGDYVYTVIIEQWRADAIDEWFKQHTSITEASSKELREIIRRQGKIRVKISHDSKKAKSLRKKIAKYFHIPQDYIIDGEE